MWRRRCCSTARRSTGTCGVSAARSRPIIPTASYSWACSWARSSSSPTSRAVPDVDVTIDFISISRFAPDSGRVKILHDLECDIGGRDVVVVEDIVDTGLTLAYLVGQLSARGPRRLSTCAMLDRPMRRIVPQGVDYRGLELGTEYVLGYGLHVRDLYRNVPYVVAADRDTLVSRPDAYVDDLYRRQDSPSSPGGRVTVVPTEEP